MQLEGIVAKDKNSRDHPGKRSSGWFKSKTRQRTECVVIGYTKGKGDREAAFGALQLAEPAGSGWLYRGKVGTGFDVKLLKNVYSELQKYRLIERPIKEKPLEHANTVWAEPRLICEIQYASLTENQTYREPVFLRLLPDFIREPEDD